MIGAMTPIFRKNGYIPHWKIIMEINFWNRYFHFRIYFGLFWADSDRKKFSKNVCLCHFFDLWLKFFENKAMLPEKRHNWKNSKSIFSLWNTFWYILNRFRSKIQKSSSLPFFDLLLPFFEKTAIYYDSFELLYL